MPGNLKIDDLLKQPMNRGQFLRNIGLLILSIIGISNALHILSGRSIHHITTETNTKKPGHGFGSSKYGI